MTSEVNAKSSNKQYFSCKKNTAKVRRHQNLKKEPQTTGSLRVERKDLGASLTTTYRGTFLPVERWPAQVRVGHLIVSVKQRLMI